MHDAEECYRLGTGHFPEVAWEWSAFLQAWRESVRGESASAPAEDQFIHLACLHGRPGAAEALDREYLVPLRGTIRRVCVTDDATDLALQDLRDKLLVPPHEKLASYRPSGSLRAWLSVVATRTALDAVRRAGAEARRAQVLEDELEALVRGPEAQLASEQLREILRLALRAAVKRLPEEQQEALRMHVLLGWNIGQIGRVLSVHRATVARWLVAAKDALRVSVGEELARLGACGEDGKVTFEAFPSRLDLTLSRVFASTGVFEHADAREV